MNKQPQRVTITPEREQQLKEHYGYSKLFTFSPSFLDEYKEQIVAYFPNPEAKKRLLENMGTITEFFIADRTKNGLSRLCCGASCIQMDEEYAEITDTSFHLKDGYEYIETIFVHELLHAASRQKGNTISGVMEFIRDADGKAIKGPNNRKNIGLNEGLTQFFAEKISGKKVPDDIDSYTFNKKVVYLFAEILGENVLKTSYFGNNSNLKDMLNDLAQDESFYEDFNKRLDTINRMENAIRKIKKGIIIPKDPESTARMETVLEAQKTALMENVFAKVIIPQIQKIEVPAITNFDDKKQVEAHNNALKQRQAHLLQILSNNPDLLKPVIKYIPNHKDSEFVTNEVLTGIQTEITTSGMSFDKIMEASRRINTTYKIGPRIAQDFISAVDTFYSENDTVLNNHSSTLTPLLKRQLEKMVDVLDQLEEAAKKAPSPAAELSLQSYREGFLKKHFQTISDLDKEIELIREERKKAPAKKPDSEERRELPPEVASILDEARRSGQEDSRAAVHTSATPPELVSVEEPKVSRSFNLSDSFIVDNQTQAITDQRNLSIPQKVENIVRATGEFDISKDQTLTEMTHNQSMSYVQRAIDNMSIEKKQILKRSLGDDWKKALQEAYEQGYRQGLEMALSNSKQAGLKAREETKKDLAANHLPEESLTPISLDEVRYVHANFEVKEEDGKTTIVDKVTSQEVKSERTKQTALFAREWVKATGDQSFSPEQAQVYRLIQKTVSSDLVSKGTIDLDEMALNADAIGGNGKNTIESLFSNNQPSPAIENFFHIQTPNAKAKEPVQAMDVAAEEHVSHR